MKSWSAFTYDAHGNRTAYSQWVSGVAYLSGSATYNANGTVATVNDVNNAQTTYAYNGTGGCNNLLPTTINGPLGLSRSMQWDCNGGVVTQAIDENGQVTTYAYNDPLWRLTSVTDPLTNVTNINYGINPSTAESALNFNGTTSTVDTLTVVDGLGRPYLTQRKQSQTATNYDTVQSFVDSNGRLDQTGLLYQVEC